MSEIILTTKQELSNTIKKLVEKGIIRSTKDGLIPESAINDYLGQ